MIMHRPVLLLSLPLLLAGITGISGCSKPEVPEHDERPEPQATPAATATPPTELREAMQQPIDKAEAVQAASDAAAEQQRKAIDAATGN
jgi:hypothetical protein